MFIASTIQSDVILITIAQYPLVTPLAIAPREIYTVVIQVQEYVLKFHFFRQCLRFVANDRTECTEQPDVSR